MSHHRNMRYIKGTLQRTKRQSKVTKYIASA